MIEHCEKSLKNNTYNAVILRFDTIASFDFYSVPKLLELCLLVRSFSLPLLLLGLPESLAEELHEIDENLFEARSFILELTHNHYQNA